jgi:uncharacterized membrane protein
MRIEHTIEIDAPVERVWEVTLDVESWPEHTPTIESIERLDDGPVTIGSQARIKQPGQRAKVWTVSALDSEKRFAWSTKAFGTKMTGDHLLEATDEGTTRNTLAIEMHGGLAPVVGALLRRPILAAITKENEGVKSAAEAN